MKKLTLLALAVLAFAGCAAPRAMQAPEPIVHQQTLEEGRTEVQQDVVKKLYLGMPSSELRSIYVKPEQINTTVTAYGTHEQWVYGFWGLYVYVKNDKVSSWQTETIR